MSNRHCGTDESRNERQYPHIIIPALEIVNSCFFEEFLIVDCHVIDLVKNRDAPEIPDPEIFPEIEFDSINKIIHLTL